MYKNRRINKNSKTTTDINVRKRHLNTIEENTTIKLPKPNEQEGETAISSSQNDSLANGGVCDTEENIPASQEPTQRYLSQRSVFAGTLSRTQSRFSPSNRLPSTYFEMILNNAGVTLYDEEAFMLSNHHIAVVSKFRELIVKSQNYPENIETFKNGLSDALEPKSKFVLKLLSGCTINVPGECLYQSQDSMLVNFLMIDFLRDHVIEILLQKIETLAVKEKMFLVDGMIPLLPLMLSHLRNVNLTHSDLINERIKEIFRKASDEARNDIIASAEIVIEPNKHDDFAQLLLDNYATSRDLFSITVLNTLTNLNLSESMLGKLHDKIVAYIIENQCSNELLPSLIKFLMIILNYGKVETMINLVNTLRNILIWYTNSYFINANNQIKIEIFDVITQALTRSRKFYTLWQKTIAKMPPIQFRSIDFLILLLLIRIKEDNSLYIENIMRRLIKLKHLTVDTLDECKDKFASVMQTNILMQILHDFLREKNKTVADFARSSYSILFQIGEETQKDILKKLLQLSCDKSAQNMNNLALELLKDLQRKYPENVQNWCMLLMPLIDRLHDMSLSQTRIVMELLCALAYPAPTLSECLALQDQIDMLVKKQLINREISIKKQGIIGIVQLIDSIARTEKTRMGVDDLNISYTTISDLPKGRGRIAANYIERIYSATVNCPNTLALFYDELATTFISSPKDRTNSNFLDKPFIIWLCETTTSLFQNNFILEQTPDPINGIQLSQQKCINSLADFSASEEQSELHPITVNISELVLQPNKSASTSVVILAPLFSLVRTLHWIEGEGCLAQIDALLGCSILLPTFFDNDNIDDVIYENYDVDMQRKILDIYFYCANWMREIISSFCTQQEQLLHKKVLQRLAQLIEIEQTIKKLLVKAPYDYMPPTLSFISSSNKINTRKPIDGKALQLNNRTITKSNKTHNESDINDKTNINHTILGRKTKLNNKTKLQFFETLYGPKEIYRQMHSDIMLFLNENLCIEYPLPKEKIGQDIGLMEFHFILTDLVGKLESVTGIQKFHTEQQLQYIAKPDFFMSDLSKFLPKLITNMNKIFNVMNEKLDEVNRVLSHAEIFTVSFSYLKVCFGLCLRLLAAYFSMSNLNDPTRSNLLKTSLLCLLQANQQQSYKKQSTAKIAVEAFANCLKYESTIVNLKTAVDLYNLLLVLKHHSNAIGKQDVLDKQATEIRTLCNTLLRRKYFTYANTIEKGSLCNFYLDELLKGFLHNSDFKRQKDICRIVYDECQNFNGRDPSLKSFPNIKKANFPIVFRGLNEVLIVYLKDIIATDNMGDCDDKLEIWERSVYILNLLLKILQSLDIPRNFQCFLKYSHLFLKLLLQNGLDIIESFLRKNPERVSDLFKNLQTTTRFLHQICCHSKAIKNSTIGNLIPGLRETLETLVFSVKALLVANKCASVFTLSNLKNKDLQGDEIRTQYSLFNAPEENSDEEIPEDDDSVDETIIDEESTINRTKSNERSKSSSRSKCF